MSFRFKAFEIAQFDENLFGYAQDEDLAFCLSLRKPLGVTPFTAIWHDKTPDSRLEPQTFKEKAIVNRYYVVKSLIPNEFSELDFAISLFFQFLSLIRKPIVNKMLIKGLINGAKKWLRFRKNPSVSSILGK
jgi:GT2 family glycosyltransferase